MPFTLAHTAAALPLRRVGLVWSALLVGTLAPDFEYFVRLAPDDGYGHTLPGTFLLTLPLALVVLWLWHAAVKAPLFEFVPDEIRGKLAGVVGEFRFGSVARFTWIVASILIGISTHLLWDAFTHPNTWIYRSWPALRESHNLPVLGDTPVYKMFQHGSTVVGMSVLVIWVGCWYWSREVSAVPRDRSTSGIWILAVMVLIASAVAMARASAVTGIPTNHVAQKRFVGLWVVTTIALMWWQLVLYGFWRTRKTAR
jgi:hypothetical protein